MICLETQHFNVNRILLLILGLWPYKRSLLVRVQLVFLFGILTTYIFFQFTTFMTAKFTADLLLQVLSSTFFFACLAIKYNSFIVNIDTMRNFLEQLQDVCNELKDDHEIAIIEKYGIKAKRYTTTVIMIGLCAESILLFLQTWPYIRYIVQSTNESQSHTSLLILTEYFIDQEKYFYLIILHRQAAISIGAFAMVATGTMLIAFFHHTCGMFSIASYRIEQAITIVSRKDVLKNEKKIHEEIIYAIDIHRKAMEFSEFLISNFEGSFFFLIVIGVTCLSLNLLRAASCSDNIEQIFQPLTIITILYIYLFLSNYTAQEITDHNENVFVTVYNVQWYAAPLHVQKTMLFLLQRGTKTFTLILGGIFVASMESAATLMSASISYFTVLYSTRQDQ